MTILTTSVHPSWDGLIKKNRAELEKICAALDGAEFDPAPELVMRFARVDLAKVKVVILGQDPYPQKGAATGRSFEVGGLESWTKPFPQSSLRNIVRAIYKSQSGNDAKWSEVRRLIAGGEFKILPPHKLWDALEAQGVLFLNSFLTVETGKPLSHRALWVNFSREVVKYIDENTACAWFLWGNGARAYEKYISRGRIYSSRHPMMSTRAEDDFMKNPCFRETADIIDWTGISVKN